MTDPVVAADGHSYDRAAIEGWFRSGHRTSPMTGQTLQSQALIPNHRLRQMIESIDEHERRPQPAIVSGRVVASARPTWSLPCNLSAGRVGDSRGARGLVDPESEFGRPLQV